MSDDQDGCEWVSVSSGTGLPVVCMCACMRAFMRECVHVCDRTL